MREHLIAFIRGVQERMHTERKAQHMFRLGGAESPELTFGYQYAQPYNVIFWGRTGEAEGEFSVEEGVDRFLKAYGLED